MAGDVVALGVFGFSVSGGGGEIRIIDLQTGAVKTDRDPSTNRSSNGYDVRALVVAPTGSAAWILCEVPGHDDCQVVDEVAFGPNTLLDRSNKIDPKSLTLHGTTLSWRTNHKTKTATLG
jgi:hypothetical protein